MNQIGPKIRALRIEKRMTQEQLTTQLNLRGFDISRGTLAKIEVKKRGVSDFEVKIFADVLGVSTDELFEEAQI